jgi:hypothetical protein
MAAALFHAAQVAILVVLIVAPFFTKPNQQ